MKKHSIFLLLIFSAACLAFLLAGSHQALAQQELNATKQLVVIPSFSPIAEKAKPALVNISVTKVVPGKNYMTEEDFFDYFFGNPRSPHRDRDQRKAAGQGSGFIFDPEGYIITNNHVIENAEEIKIKLSDGEELDVEVIGRDSKTDLALLKIKKKGAYPFLNLGDSEAVKIGDWVVALGNPFGLEHTVTAGILSARGRSIGAGPYDDFLQTDASINPGNSGGPLLNLNGEVIGINTAIVGGSSGIGFAIPSNMAKDIVKQLKSGGKVTRGWLGVALDPNFTAELAKSFGLDSQRGALVTEIIEPEGPAGKAGLKHGDIILKFDGKEVKNLQNLQLIVANTEVGKKTKVVIWRDKKEVTLDITVGQMLDDPADTANKSAEVKNNIGITIQQITPEISKKMGLKSSAGFYIAAVEPDSAAQEGGLARGDVIIEIEGQAIKNTSDYNKALENKKKGDSIRFYIKRNNVSKYCVVKIR